MNGIQQWGGYGGQQLAPQGLFGGMLGGPLGGLIGKGIGGLFGNAGLGSQIGQMAGGIGGSLLPLGGQNMIEPCACGKPVLFGPHTFNFTQASAGAVDSGAAWRVDDAGHLFRSAFDLFADPAQRGKMSAAALRFADSQGGATQKTQHLIRKLLN